MSLVITKECFPAAHGCHNCQRKSRPIIGEKTDERKEFQRCSGCHLLTYCDKQCQVEHWEKVHKRHCKFLSGRKPVENSRHREETCAMCIEENQTSFDDIVNRKSPKTACHNDKVIEAMKIMLGKFFGFHGDGKICNCSLKFCCELPFPLGEVSDQYTDGPDGMFAHATKIVNALFIKNKKDTDRTETLTNISQTLISLRSARWRNILVYGVSNCIEDKAMKSLTDPVKGLKVHSGPSNAWWKALMITVKHIENMNVDLASEFMDGSSIEDTIYRNIKVVHDYRQLQLSNQVFVSENNLWSKFKLWPSLSGNSLEILLPDETHCQTQTCKAPLTGQFKLIGEGNRSHPILMPRVGENGKLVAVCPVLQNQRCLRDYLSKDAMLRVQAYEDNRKNYIDECKIFTNKGRYCDMCLKMSIFSHRCSECHAAQYCSTQCQGKDLEFHKTVCSTWVKDKSRMVVSSKQQRKIYKSKMKDLK